jgi:N utilization substance protein B
MASEHRIVRRLALQAMYQLDARSTLDGDDIRQSLIEEQLEEKPGEDESTVHGRADRAMILAQAAFQARKEADDLVRELAPTWPPERQPAIDRAIMRLAHHEMTSGVTPPKVAVNEAIELAKRFSTENSPAFINGLLDKALKRVLAGETNEADHSESV